MKNKQTIIVIITVLLMATGCTGGNDLVNNTTNVLNNTTNQPAYYQIEDLYPYDAQTEKVFVVSGDSSAEYIITTNAMHEKYLQETVFNVAITTSRVWLTTESELRLVIMENATIEDVLSSTALTYDVFIKEPIVTGNEWTDIDGNRRYISSVSKRITTPFMAFDAIEVTTVGDDYQRMDYYAPYVGLVQSVYKSATKNVTYSLLEIRDANSK